MLNYKSFTISYTDTIKQHAIVEAMNESLEISSKQSVRSQLTGDKQIKVTCGLANIVAGEIYALGIG